MNKIKNAPYIFVYMPDHPSSNESGYVREHILVAEKKIGRHLIKNETVHHIDENKHNNSDNNIMIFKTNGDHARYHSSIRHNLNYSLTCINNVFTCIILYENYDEQTRHESSCPLCGCTKSTNSAMCHDCYSNNRKSNIKISKSELESLISSFSFTAIGNMHGISGNAVKKWCKKYDIYESKIHKSPDRDALLNLLLKNTVSEVANAYNVGRDIVCRWINENHIIIIDEKIKCVETCEIFDSLKQAYKTKYPTIGENKARENIKKSISEHTEFEGYHWITIDKQVS